VAKLFALNVSEAIREEPSLKGITS
jgi:hypothetical protein